MFAEKSQWHQREGSDKFNGISKMCLTKISYLYRQLKQQWYIKENKNSDFITHLTSKKMNTTLITERGGEEMKRSDENDADVETIGSKSSL